MYKLLCTDMDGTLLNSEGKISEKNLKYIKMAHDKGVKVTICTGRIYTSASYFADLIGVQVPVIAANGAYIREKDRDEVIYKSVLGYENCKKVLKVLKKYEINPHFNSPSVIFTGKISHASANYEKANKILPKDKQIDIRVVENWEEIFIQYEDDILKCICIDDDIKKLFKAKEELLQQEGLEVVSSNYNNFEVMCKGVSKGKAVEILAGYYNIKKEDIICIGDNENDISMIKYAGLGVAMENGESFVKNAADYITKSNNEDGVAKVIEKFIIS
ncbi:Cof-like hydrolase [Clostridiales bacterium oral taxon 876 str. F0540]|nr:Cof-like hydrolase [Clostridiales bacterium oral taxon 876 str. F0540]